MWTQSHGPDKLYDKFTVVQNSSGKTITGGDEFVFVMRPESDHEAYMALHSYANYVASRSPELAQSIMRELQRISDENS